MHRTKYPRTSHLPWSPGFEPDDLHLADLSGFVDREVVVTEKLDGENTTIYADGTCHARSLDSGAHPSRTRVKALAARLLGALPEGTRICGENVYARHSLAYDDLLGHFYGFSVWTGDRCWSWDATVELLHGLGIPTPRVRFRGPFDRRAIRGLKVHAHREEGYVVRWADGFDRDAFPRAVAKWVRPSHVQTDVHWMSQPVVPNGLAPASALWDVRSGVEPDEAGLDAVFGDTRPLLPVELPARGETRLALVVAGRYAADPRGTLLPTL
ncbi:MAG: RNA ligase family protein, partial [Myxococcales bacterium]|nr:RNA ligase family protein [Myxococcales bacterium]